MRIAKEFTFDSAHFLKDYKGKCERIHGHTYKMRVIIEGEIQKNGLVMDFSDIKEIVNKNVIDKWDHNIINDTLEHASVENMCVWAWEQLKKDLPTCRPNNGPPSTSWSSLTFPRFRVHFLNSGRFGRNRQRDRRFDVNLVSSADGILNS